MEDTSTDAKDRTIVFVELRPWWAVWRPRITRVAITSGAIDRLAFSKRFRPVGVFYDEIKALDKANELLCAEGLALSWRDNDFNKNRRQA